MVSSDLVSSRLRVFSMVVGPCRRLMATCSLGGSMGLGLLSAVVCVCVPDRATMSMVTNVFSMVFSILAMSGSIRRTTGAGDGVERLF